MALLKLLVFVEVLMFLVSDITRREVVLFSFSTDLDVFVPVDDVSADEVVFALLLEVDLSSTTSLLLSSSIVW